MHLPVLMSADSAYVYCLLCRRRPFLIRPLENTLIKLLRSLDFYDEPGRTKIAMGAALALMRSSLCIALSNSRRRGSAESPACLLPALSRKDDTRQGPSKTRLAVSQLNLSDCVRAATARCFAGKLGVQSDRVLNAVMNDRMVAKGLVLHWATAFFVDFLATEPMDDLVAILRKVRCCVPHLGLKT